MLAKLCLDIPPSVSAMGIPRHGEAKHYDDYLLPEHWCFHIYSYNATLELDGISHAIHPQYASLVPAGVRMVYRYSGPSEHVYFHFKPGSMGKAIEIPMVIPLGMHYESMDARARHAAGLAGQYPAYATATLWSLLWELADPGFHGVDRQLTDTHPLVNAAVRHIEQRLSGPISVEQLCVEVGVSYGYLTRLFKVWLGVPVSEYVSRRRAEQAEHLLTSTTLPIKVIARTIGVPDLQQFNRLMHRVKGASPRNIRLGPARPSEG